MSKRKIPAPRYQPGDIVVRVPLEHDNFLGQPARASVVKIVAESVNKGVWVYKYYCRFSIDSIHPFYEDELVSDKEFRLQQSMLPTTGIIESTEGTYAYTNATSTPVIRTTTSTYDPDDDTPF